MQKIIPNLWFDKNAEEAAQFYTSIFRNGKILNTSYYSEAGHDIHEMEAGTVLTVEFQIENMRFIALNGGPLFTPNPSISFTVNCPTKEEVDELWEKLSEEGEALMPLQAYSFSERYGWIQDKYGFSWQLFYSDQTDTREIIPSLIFVGEQYGNVEEAINFYTSVFDDSAVGRIFRYEAGSEPEREGAVMYADFTLENQRFSAMESAREHNYMFNGAVSLLVECEDQEEIDYYWEKLSAVPEAEQCGWLKDKYGVSWQIIPENMEKLLNDADKEKANKAMEAMLKMKKIDIATLEEVVS